MLIRSKENTFTALLQGGDESVFLKGISLLEILEYIRPTKPETIVLARVNNRIYNLRECVEDDCSIEWVRLHALDGIRSYQKTLCMILIRAVGELYPDAKFRIEQPLVNGLIFQTRDWNRIGRRMIKKIKNRMMEIIQNDEPIEPNEVLRNQAMAFFDEMEQRPILFLENQELARITLYQSGKFEDYFGYPLFHSTGYLKYFDVRFSPRGLILVFPDLRHGNLLPNPEQRKRLFGIIDEHNQWKKIIGFQDVGDVNDALGGENSSDLIQVAEGIHEKRITSIAEAIIWRAKRLRIVFVLGPSSSGRSILTQRLGIHLRVNGHHPILLSMDDYYLDDDHSAESHIEELKSEFSHVLDTSHLNNDINRLLRGEKVQLPRYDIKEKKRVLDPPCRLGPQQTILIHGNHTLYNDVARRFKKNEKLTIYIDALTSMNITDHLAVEVSDIGLLRNLIRDYFIWNLTVDDSLTQWRPFYVEERENIFPYLEKCDIVFNTSLFFELGVLRYMAEPILEAVKSNQPSYPEAQRLLQLLLCFSLVSRNEVPSNSILREFIGSIRFDPMTKLDSESETKSV